MKTSLNKKGFTLMETVVALSIAAIALSFFVAAFAPATIGIRRANSVEEAKVLGSALEAEMNMLRPTQDAGNASAFEKSFAWVALDEAVNTGLILAFRYRADASTAADADGLYLPYLNTFTDKSDAQPMILQNRIAPLSTFTTATGATALDAVEGSVFAVKLYQMVKDSGTGILQKAANGDEIVDSADNVITGVVNYLEPVILIRAEFYLLDSNAKAYLTSLAPVNDLPNKPLHTMQFGVVR